MPCTKEMMSATIIDVHTCSAGGSVVVSLSPRSSDENSCCLGSGSGSEGRVSSGQRDGHSYSPPSTPHGASMDNGDLNRSLEQSMIFSFSPARPLKATSGASDRSDEGINPATVGIERRAKALGIEGPAERARRKSFPNARLFGRSLTLDKAGDGAAATGTVAAAITSTPTTNASALSRLVGARPGELLRSRSDHSVGSEESGSRHLMDSIDDNTILNDHMGRQYKRSPAVKNDGKEGRYVFRVRCRGDDNHFPEAFGEELVLRNSDGSIAISGRSAGLFMSKSKRSRILIMSNIEDRNVFVPSSLTAITETHLGLITEDDSECGSGPRASFPLENAMQPFNTPKRRFHSRADSWGSIDEGLMMMSTPRGVDSFDSSIASGGTSLGMSGPQGHLSFLGGGHVKRGSRDDSTVHQGSSGGGGSSLSDFLSG